MGALMPDLTEHIVPTCMSNLAWSGSVASASDSEVEYHVTWGPAPPWAEVQFGWHCTCRDFYYQTEQHGFGHHCKHINQIINQDLRCAWNEAIELVSNNYDVKWIDGHKQCPKCEGPITYVRIAV